MEINTRSNIFFLKSKYVALREEKFRESRDEDSCFHYKLESIILLLKSHIYAYIHKYKCTVIDR